MFTASFKTTARLFFGLVALFAFLSIEHVSACRNHDQSCGIYGACCFGMHCAYAAPEMGVCHYNRLLRGGGSDENDKEVEDAATGGSTEGETGNPVIIDEDTGDLVVDSGSGM